jgi:hypothetical protein
MRPGMGKVRMQLDGQDGAMSEQTKRTGAIVAVLAFVLAVGLSGYWLGRGAAPQARTPSATQSAVVAASPASSRANKPVLPKPRNSTSAAAPPERINASSIPLKWRFAGITHYQSGDDSESWLAQFADHHDAIVRFNQRYPYAWNVSSPEEIAWLAKNGFPMPEDVIAADAMSDDDLRREADAGSSKALILYYERLSSELLAADRDELNKGGSTYEVMQRVADAMPQTEFEVGRVSSLVRGMDTPFFGYVEATRPFLEDNQTMREENLAAGLALAFARGDDRAANAVLGAAANGMLSDEQASIAYRVMATMRDYYPIAGACDPKISTPFPKPPPPE